MSESPENSVEPEDSVSPSEDGSADQPEDSVSASEDGSADQPEGSETSSDYEIIQPSPSGRVTRSEFFGPSTSRAGLRTTKSQKSGVIFPVARIKNMLKVHNYAGRVSDKGAVFLASVLQYVTAEIIELSTNVVRSERVVRIQPRHVNLAIKSDPELINNFRNAVVPNSPFLTSNTAMTSSLCNLPLHVIAPRNAGTRSATRKSKRSKKSGRPK